VKSFVIVGGGIAGLSTAFHLIRAKQKVTVVDEFQTGQGVSHVAAGMITPASEVHLGETELMRTFLNASSYYTDFISTITEDNPDIVDFHRSGSLLCATESDGVNELCRLADFQNKMGFAINELNSTELKAREPYLSPRIIKAFYTQNEAYIDNVKLLSQLKAYLIHHGCEIIENKKVVSFNQSDDSIILSNPEPVTIKADCFILATGLQNSVEGFPEIPMRSVKGQTVVVQANSGVIKQPTRVHHRYPIYLVPREDGRIVIGASSEEKSDNSETAGNIMDLIYGAWQALPLVYECPVIETMVGHRPAAPDHKPIVGRSLHNNLFVLTGLYRHGILAAPYLSKELANLILDKDTEIDWPIFSLERF